MFAGSPTATHPIGTTAPARRVRRWTVACTLTSLRRPSTAPWKIAAPVATNTSSSRVAPRPLQMLLECCGVPVHFVHANFRIAVFRQQDFELQGTRFTFQACLVRQ